MARMDSTLFAQYSAPQQFTFVSAEMYAQVFPASPAMSHASSSFGQSPAQQTHPLPVASPRQFYSTYDQPAGEVFSEDDFSSASSACSNGVETHYQYTTATAVATYGGESIPRNMTWAKEEPVEYTTIPPVALESQLPNGVYAEGQATYSSYFESVPPGIASYYDEEALAQESQLSAYTAHQDTLPAMVHNFSQSPQIVHAHLEQEQPSSPESTFSAAEPGRLHYVPEPQEPPSQFVSPQDVSPSPVVSPDPAYSTLPAGSPTAMHYVVVQPATPSPATPAPSTHDDDYATAYETPTPKPARKRRRVTSDEEDYSHASDSGESEKDDSDDDEYRPAAREGLRRRRSSARAAPAPPPLHRDASPSELLLPRLAPPVPVPNLTKKSRGRQVPTSAVLVRHNGVEKNVRSYKCKVPGCSKYFQRGEHLKRHVRSIHTNEKPHKCPYRACGKDFSRHDNLRQHMRVHRNDRLDSEETSGSG